MAALTENQANALWDLWLSAQIREGYFALLCRRYQLLQKWLTAGSLVFSSGAFFSLVTTVVPPKYDWIKPVLTLLAAILSAVSLVSKNEKNAIDCQDLHFRWLVLATDYEKLWNDVYADDASERYDALRLREAEISRSSTAVPQKNRLLSKVQANVTMHHSEAAA